MLLDVFGIEYSTGREKEEGKWVYTRKGLGWNFT